MKIKTHTRCKWNRRKQLVKMKSHLHFYKKRLNYNIKILSSGNYSYMDYESILYQIKEDKMNITILDNKLCNGTKYFSKEELKK